MNSLFDRYFVVYCLCWLMIRITRWLSCPLPWLNSYLTDFLFVPATAHLTQWLMRKFILRDNTYTLPLSYILFIALYGAVVLEWIAPMISTRHTADWGDVVAYFLGALFYYFFHLRGNKAEVSFRKNRV